MAWRPQGHERHALSAADPHPNPIQFAPPMRLALLPLLFAACLLPATPLPARAAEPGPDLIRQAQFAERYAQEVQPHWAARAQLGTFESEDGLALHYARLLQPGARATVVIVNGRTESLLKYKELAWDLNRAGYSVYVADHRGQGLSPRLLPDPTDHDKGHVERFDDYVRDLARFITQVVRPEQPGKLFLLAHSMGGAIALRHLQQHPGVATAAVLSSPMLEPNAKILFSVGSSCGWFRQTAWMCPTCYAGFLPEPYQQTPETLGDYTHSAERWAVVLEEFKQAPKAQLGGPTRQWVSEACRVTEPMLAQAGEVRTPLLMLQAGDDTAVVNEAQDTFCRQRQAATGLGCGAQAGGPVRLQGAAHELFIEADVHRVPAIQALLGFLARH